MKIPQGISNIRETNNQYNACGEKENKDIKKCNDQGQFNIDDDSNNKLVNHDKTFTCVAATIEAHKSKLIW